MDRKTLAQLVLHASHAPRTTGWGRRAVLHSVVAGSLVVALPLPAQARLAMSTAINRTARFRALSQRMAKAYTQLFLNVQVERGREVLILTRQLIGQGFEELVHNPWPDDVAQLLAQIRTHADKLEAMTEQKPSKEQVSLVSQQSEKMLEAANNATLALEKIAQAGTAKLVNMAGRLRWLSQRLAKNYFLLAAGLDSKTLREQMAADTAQFKSTLEVLKSAPLSTPAIRAQLEQAQGQWVFFDASLQRHPDARGQEAMATTSERLLEVMESLTGLYAAALADILG